MLNTSRVDKNSFFIAFHVDCSSCWLFFMLIVLHVYYALFYLLLKLITLQVPVDRTTFRLLFKWITLHIDYTSSWLTWLITQPVDYSSGWLCCILNTSHVDYTSCWLRFWFITRHVDYTSCWLRFWLITHHVDYTSCWLLFMLIKPYADYTHVEACIPCLGVCLFHASILHGRRRRRAVLQNI